MKKLTTIIGAILLVLCFTQCRKEVKTVTPEEAKGYPITLTMDETSKVDVNVVEGEHFGEVTFRAGDKIYVANQGRFVGTITHDGSKFEGTIYDPTPEDPIEGYLYFYFLGNKTPSENVSKPEDIANYETYHPTTLTVSISDQSGSQMPLLSCGKSNKVFSGGGSDYSARLGNKCALAKFNITKASGASSKDVLIEGVNNKVVFDLTKISVYTDANVSYSKADGGYINVGNRTGDIWLILLPQDDDEGGMAYTSDKTYYGSRGSLKGVVANHAIKTPIQVNVNTKKPKPSEYPEGTIQGVFSVSKAGGKVFFSKGNLQYQASTNTWRFAENQWDFVGSTSQSVSYGTVEGSSNNEISSTYSGWIDLFGWGTSGYNHGAVCYQPYSIVKDNSKYYAYGNSGSQLYDGDGRADWGYNAISNGGNTENKWRNLKSGEWEWLLGPASSPAPGTNCRNSSFVNGTANARFTFAIINTGGTPVKGLIIFPDLYLAGTPSGVTWGVINDKSPYSTTCTVGGWEELEKAGCVFLPAAGRRDGTSVNYTNGNNNGALGIYWASNRNANTTAYNLRFGYKETEYYFEPKRSGSSHRYFGYSVRVVQDYTE